MRTKILLENKLINYDFNLFSNNGKISFNSGDKIEVQKGVKYIVPGFIDRHTHGGYGFDFMDADIEGNKKMLNSFLKEGITSVYATTMTMEYKTIEKAIASICDWDYESCNILGIHLEGPFLNLGKIGAQNPKFLKTPDVDFVIKNKKNIKLVSYAPELDDDFSFIKCLNVNNIVASTVHSEATYNEIMAANKYGLKNFSHFYNGCSAFSHRDPGIVNAGLALNDTYLELICDGIHVNKDVIKYTYDTKGIESIVLITDAMRAKGMPDGDYSIGGQKVILKDDTVRLETGSLSGSILKMNECVKNFYEFTCCDLQESFIAASYNVAKSMNNENKGIISQNKDFDIVMLDEDFNVVATYVNGIKKYER